MAGPHVSNEDKMSKEVQMTFRVEAELRAEFTAAALQEHRPAAQVIREFMRAYVNEARSGQVQPLKATISSAERRRRERAVSFARASVNLEGFEPSKAEEANAVRLIEGDIELTEFALPKADA